MNLELDHFFILTEPGAKAGDLLVSLGVEESFSRDHQGQGTSNRRFPVSNSMLELLWLRDEGEAKNGPGKDLLFPERSKAEGASPFGLIFRRKDSVDNSQPFPGWKYQPDYFNPPMAFHVGDNSNSIEEPLCIYVPFVEPVERKVEEGTFQSISKVKITVPSTFVSDTLLMAGKSEGLEVILGDEHLMEVTFNVGACGMTKDLRPNLPLIIRW
ncbi:hypothetical protein R50073_35570 [Maricurvus nonylphenolicus]|uniref:hypothetical protein n=1 Tax=Maricurvus nonylphenolicus TaxID=1008307 RepID=UPI0036F4372F